MKKCYRIKKSEQIEEIIKKGFSKSNPYFVIYKHKNTNNQHFRIAISAPKKLGNAVLRNNIKRKIRNSVMHNREKLNAKYDYFIVAREKCISLKFEEFNKNFSDICMKIIKENNKRK